MDSIIGVIKTKKKLEDLRKFIESLTEFMNVPNVQKDMYEARLRITKASNVSIAEQLFQKKSLPSFKASCPENLPLLMAKLYNENKTVKTGFVNTVQYAGSMPLQLFAFSCSAFSFSKEMIQQILNDSSLFNEVSDLFKKLVHTLDSLLYRMYSVKGLPGTFSAETKEKLEEQILNRSLSIPDKIIAKGIGYAQIAFDRYILAYTLYKLGISFKDFVKMNIPINPILFYRIFNLELFPQYSWIFVRLKFPNTESGGYYSILETCNNIVIILDPQQPLGTRTITSEDLGIVFSNGLDKNLPAICGAPYANCAL